MVAEMAQDLRQGLGPQLAGSTGAGGHLGQAHGLAHASLPDTTSVGAPALPHKEGTLCVATAGA